jgi:hypothetical protein
MHTTLEETLTVELAEMLGRYIHRQAELVGCLRSLREDLLALRSPVEGLASREPDPRSRVPESWDLSRALTTEASTTQAPISWPSPSIRASTLSSRPARRIGDAVAERPPAAVGSRGHAPKHDYNYFAALDERLSHLRARPGLEPLAIVTESSGVKRDGELGRTQ